MAKVTATNKIRMHSSLWRRRNRSHVQTSIGLYCYAASHLERLLLALTEADTLNYTQSICHIQSNVLKLYTIQDSSQIRACKGHQKNILIRFSGRDFSTHIKSAKQNGISGLLCMWNVRWNII